MTGQLNAPRLGEIGKRPIRELGFQETKERSERGLNPAVRSGREKNEMLARPRGEIADEFVALVLADVSRIDDGRAVSLVDDHEFGTIQKKRVLVAVRLDEIDADDLDRIKTIDAFCACLSAFQLADRA